MSQVRLIKPVPVEGAQAQSNNEIQFGVSAIEAPKLWNQEITGKGVVVAVLDTGCQINHPDLGGRVIVGKNFTSEGAANDVTDLNGHGTHVTGTIVAKRDGIGVVGAAPDAKALICKVLDKNGDGTYAGVINAISYAISWRGPVGERVRVINMSLGGPDPSAMLHNMVKAAINAGILVVCAAGNDGDGRHETNEHAYPGSYQEVVTVGAIDNFYSIAPFSNTHDEIDFVAYGVAVKSTYLGGQYAYSSGTSMAAPHIAGAAALIIEQWEQDYGRTITEPELYSQLVQRCKTFSSQRRAEGNGMPVLTYNYMPPSGWEAITIEQAIAKMEAAGVMDTPKFWTNLLAKFKAEPDKYHDFRYVELLIRKMAAKL